MAKNSTPPIQIDKFTWAQGDVLAYLHPVTGAKIPPEVWQKFVERRAKRLKDG